MRKNYLKSYFKSFGFLATIMVILLFAVAGLGLYVFNILKTANYQSIAAAALMVVVGGGAFVGLTGLRNNKVCMTDFIRISFFVASIILGVLVILSGSHTRQMIVYFVVAAIYLVEVIVRCLSITEDAGDMGMKAYFGAIGYRYNPLVLVCVAMILTIALGIGARNGMLDALPVLNSANMKYFALGGAAALLTMLFVAAMDKETDASVLDCILVVLFLTALYSPIVIFKYLDKTLIRLLLLVAALSLVGLLARAVFYNKSTVYDTNRHKANTYYRCVFGKYNILLAVLFGVVVVLLGTLAVLYADASTTLYANFHRFIKGLSNYLFIMVFSVVALVVVLALTVLLFVFRKFKSTEPEKVDWVIVTLLIATGFAIPFLACATPELFGLMTSNILVLVFAIVFVVVFILAAVLQIIRIRNFDSMAAIIAAEAEQRMREKKEAKEAEKAAKEEAEKAEAEKNYDPFALTEEDEAIYAAQYGEEEKKEEEPKQEENPYAEEEEEAPVEEVVEEEAPAEEPAQEQEETQDEFDAFLNSVPEKTEEAPAEEPEPAQEEAPAEEENPYEEEEEGEEEEDEDTEDAEEAEEAEEESEPHEESHAKEAAIEIQEYVAVDEEGKPKKIKRKFNTKMMFAPYETKEYYNEIKNYLMMYRAKGRYSARCESFRYKGLVAKLALGGKAIKVFLALDPQLIEQYPKYHLKDVSEKRQYAEVPVMIKVRSDRSLKYCKELIDLMFANRLVKPKRNFEPTNYVPQLIPNGEAILGNLGMETYYLQNTMNVNGIPAEMPDDLVDYLPMIPGDELDGEEEEAVAYLDTLCLHFEDGDEVTLDVLKSMHICQKGNILRIKARGTLDRKLIIYAEKFDDDALKMIMCTNGTAVRIVRE